MSQYNAAPLPAADHAGQNATDLELAPFLPTMNQSGDWNPPAGARRPVGSTAALPPNVGFASLHDKAESIGPGLHPVCCTCSALFPTNHQLEQHAAKTKHKAYLCTCGCQKGFTKRSALRRHIQESAQPREHRCPVCKHKCKRPGHVEQHLRLKHKKSKDEIKRLLSTQKSQPRQQSEQASTASTAAPTPGSMVFQAGNPINGPNSLWTGPMDFSATAPADYPGSRPGNPSAFFSALPVLGPGQVTGTPAFTMQSPTLPGYYPAYPVGAVPVPTWFFANSAPAVSSYPAAPLDGTNNVFNVNTASVPVNPADGFGMPDLGTDFMADFSDFDLNNSGI